MARFASGCGVPALMKASFSGVISTVRNAAFIEAFAPAAVERVPPARAAGVDEAAIRAAFVAALTPLSLEKARIAAPAPERLRPDLVVTQADAPEWPGALALAAGHRERLEFVDAIGERGGIVSRADLDRDRVALRERLRAARFVTLGLSPLGHLEQRVISSGLTSLRASRPGSS